MQEIVVKYGIICTESLSPRQREKQRETREIERWGGKTFGGKIFGAWRRWLLNCTLFEESWRPHDIVRYTWSFSMATNKIVKCSCCRPMGVIPVSSSLVFPFRHSLCLKAFLKHLHDVADRRWTKLQKTKQWYVCEQWYSGPSSKGNLRMRQYLSKVLQKNIVVS